MSPAGSVHSGKGVAMTRTVVPEAEEPGVPVHEDVPEVLKDGGKVDPEHAIVLQLSGLHVVLDGPVTDNNSISNPVPNPNQTSTRIELNTPSTLLIPAVTTYPRSSDQVPRRYCYVPNITYASPSSRMP